MAAYESLDESYGCDSDAESSDECTVLIRRCPSQDDLPFANQPPLPLPELTRGEVQAGTSTESVSHEESSWDKLPCSVFEEYIQETKPTHAVRDSLLWHGPSTYMLHCLRSGQDAEADARALKTACQHEEPVEVNFQRRRVSRRVKSPLEPPRAEQREEAEPSTTSTDPTRTASPRRVKSPLEAPRAEQREETEPSTASMDPTQTASPRRVMSPFEAPRAGHREETEPSTTSTDHTRTASPRRVNSPLEAPRTEQREEAEPSTVPSEPTRTASPATTPPVAPQTTKVWPYSLDTGVGLVDTHCHLEFLFNKVGHRGTYTRFRNEHRDTFPDCYEGCVANFCDPQSFKKRRLWEPILTEDGVWGAFGCHPHMAGEYSEEIDEHLIKALEHPKVVALGEIGLDYSRRNKCDHDKQKRVFRRQLKLAVNGRLPLIIHSRDSTPDTLSILKEMVPSDYLIHRHCFTASWQEAQRWLMEFPNLCLGLTPLVGFPNAGALVDVARHIPLDRLLIETDSPYFLPKSESGRLKASHPGMAIHVATWIASLRNIEVDDILRAVRQNTRRIYNV